MEVRRELQRQPQSKVRYRQDFRMRHDLEGTARSRDWLRHSLFGVWGFGRSSGSRLQGCSAASLFTLCGLLAPPGNSTASRIQSKTPSKIPLPSMSEHVHEQSARQHHNNNMSNIGGTYRGATPKRAGVPFDPNTPSTGIPRPKIETHPTGTGSEMSGHSTISASRQKQSKRDEVSVHGRCGRLTVPSALPRVRADKDAGYSTKDGSEPQPQKGHIVESTAFSKGPAGHRPRSEAQPGPPDQAQHHRRRSRAINGSKAGRLRIGYR